MKIKCYIILILSIIILGCKENLKVIPCEIENEIVLVSGVTETMDKAFYLLDTVSVKDSIYIKVFRDNVQIFTTKKIHKATRFIYQLSEDGKYSIQVTYLNKCDKEENLEYKFEVNSELILQEKIPLSDNSTFDLLEHVEISDDGLVYFNSGGILKVWNQKNESYFDLFNSEPGTNFTFLNLSFDQKKLLAFDFKKSHIYDIENNKVLPSTINPVGYFYFKSADNKLFALYKVGEVLVYSNENYSLINKFNHQLEGFICNRTSVNGNYLAKVYTNGKSSKLYVWNIYSKELVNSFDLNTLPQYFTLHPTTSQILIKYTLEKTIVKLDFLSRKETKVEKINFNQFEYSNDGKSLYTDYGKYNVETLLPDWTTNQSFLYNYTSNSSLAAYVFAGKISLYDGLNGSLKNNNGNSQGVLANAAAISQDGKFVTVSNTNGNYITWDIETKTQLSNFISIRNNNYSYIGNTKTFGFISCYYFNSLNTENKKTFNTYNLSACLYSYKDFISSTGKWFVAGTSEIGGLYENLSIYDLNTKQFIRKLENPGNKLSGYKISTNEKIIYGWTIQNQFLVWDFDNGTLLKNIKIEGFNNNFNINSAFVTDDFKYFGFAAGGLYLLFDYSSNKLLTKRSIFQNNILYDANNLKSYDKTNILLMQGGNTLYLNNLIEGSLYKKYKFDSQILDAGYFVDRKEIVVVTKTNIHVLKI